MYLYSRPEPCIPYRLGFSPQHQKNILVSHSRINPAPWKYLIYTNLAQGFLPDRLQNTPKIPVFQSRTPKINRYFSCAQSPRRAKNDVFARWYKVCTVYTVYDRNLVISLPKIPYIHRIYMVLANPIYDRIFNHILPKVTYSMHRICMVMADPIYLRFYCVA